MKAGLVLSSCFLVTFQLTFLFASGESNGIKSMIKTLPHDNRTYSKEEWTKIVKALKPKVEPKAKPFKQPQGAGKLGVSISSQIIGGSNALLGQFPWQAYIKIDDLYLCGGSIILKNWIMTAAHCTYQASKFVATLGSINQSADSLGFERQTTTDKYIHSLYNPDTLINDIALLKLPADVPLSNTIRLVALPPISDGSLTFEGTLATISGFGRNIDGGSASQNLKFVEMPVIPNTECVRVYGSVSVLSTTLCTKHQTKATCQGDSGGPLVYKDSSETWRQIGIVSFGSSWGCLYGPSAFTRVTSYIGWISEITGQEFSATSPTTPKAPTSSTLRTTKAPNCALSNFELMNNCCNQPLNSDLVPFNSKNRTCKATKSALKIFNKYSLNRYQNVKHNNSINITDSKLTKGLANEACFVNCYLQENGVISSNGSIDSEKLGLLLKENQEEGSEWKSAIEDLTTTCTETISGLANMPNFKNGVHNCDGKATLIVQCILSQIIGLCKEKKNDSKCVKDYSAYDNCAQSVFFSQSYKGIPAQ